MPGIFTHNPDWLIRVANGEIEGHSIVNKFGRRLSLTTSFSPVCIGGNYKTPQVSGATALRVKAGNTNDTAAGSGAREITIVGLDQTGVEQTEAIATAGASASAVTTTTWLRMPRFYVSKSGTYATSTAGSHAADIVIETSGGTEWGRIDATSFPKGQSQIGAYTVPLGYRAELLSYELTTDSNKAVDFVFFKREDILDTAAPYQAMRTVFQKVGVQGRFIRNNVVYEPFEALTDIGFMAKAAATADVTVDFALLLIQDGY